MSINNHRSLSSVNLAQLEAQLKPVQQMLAKIPLPVWQGLVRLTLVIWLAYLLAQVIWIMIPKPNIPAAKIDVSYSSHLPITNNEKSSVDIDQLKKLTPFGNPAAQVETVKNDAGNIEQEAIDTQLNLVLRGLVYSNDEKVARAVIASSDKQEVYAVGDPIPMSNNVSVAKILVDRVIIDNNGKYESLWLFKDDPKSPHIGRSYPSNPSTNNNMATAQPPIYYDEENTQNHSVPTPVEQNAMAQMGTTLSDVVAMSIHRENGQIVGYKIRPGRNAEMFNSLGLQTDDVVTAVNGMPLNNPGKIMEIYRSMGSATSANLQVLRNGSTVNLDISLNQ